MKRGTRRAVLLAFGWAALGAAQPQTPEVRLGAQLTCPPRSGSGRIVCELTVSAPAGRLLRWVDVLVVEAPEFALPLRARVAGQLPEEGTVRAALPLPLFATGENTGTLRVRARAVACISPSRCVTLARDVSAAVVAKREGG